MFLKCFFYEFYKNFCEGCSLVYLEHCLKLLRTIAFKFIIEFNPDLVGMGGGEGGLPNSSVGFPLIFQKR